MLTRFRINWLPLTAFVSGMTVMAVEMSASRLMAPYFGTSVFVWTNLLGIIMAALALGYWLGGKWIDRQPTATRLYALVIVNACVLLLLPWIAPWVMSLASDGLAEGQLSLVVQSFLSSMLVFGFPFVVLGMTSPSIIRLLSTEVEEAGRVAGQVYAASTVGSILGTFLPTLVFIPWIGTKRTILLFALVLLVVGLIGLARRRLFALALVFVLALGLTSPAYDGSADVLYEGESGYTYLKVRTDDYFGRVLEQDEGLAIHSYYHPTRLVTGSYWDYMITVPYLQYDKEAQRVTVIGSAGGTAFHILERLGGEFTFEFQGTEIDPRVVELSEQYFGMDQIDAEIKTQDGRVYLKQHPGDIDFLLVDAYHQLYIPPHLTSREFFELAESRLSPNGSVMININALFKESDVYARVVETMRTVFDYLWVMEVGAGRYNYLVIGTNNPIDFDDAMAEMPDYLAALGREAAAKTELVDSSNGAELITDDKPLSEVLFDKMVGEWLLGRSDED